MDEIMMRILYDSDICNERDLSNVLFHFFNYGFLIDFSSQSECRPLLCRKTSSCLSCWIQIMSYVMNLTCKKQNEISRETV